MDDDRGPTLLALLIVWLTICLLYTGLAAAEPPDIGPWHALWTRQKHAGAARIDANAPGGRQPVIRIEHAGAEDWSLNRRERITVTEGDLFLLEGRAKVDGQGTATLCVVAYEKGDKVHSWSYGARTAGAAAMWQPLKSRFIIPPGVAAIVPRLIGHGPATVWFDSFAIKKVGNLAAMRGSGDLADRLTTANRFLSVTLHTADGALACRDKRTGKTWTQKRIGAGVVITAAKANGRITFDWFHASSGIEGRGVVTLEADRPEFTVTLSADADLSRPLAFPHPFTADALAGGKGPAYLVVPMNEGISYPVADETIRPMRLIAYGGHGICMAFWGVTDGAAGHMAIIETPDDASIRIARAGDRLCVAPEWDPQKGRFGYPRRLRYVFFDSGGHVAMCKRYRAHAKQIGRFKTLAEKRRENPNVDLLLGAVNVWCWDRPALPIVRDMQAAGIRRILWSHRRQPDVLKALNDLPGVLTSRYDIVQDVMNPENFPRLRGVHPDWPADAWPNDLTIRADGQRQRGWRVRAKDGSMIPCGVLCDRQAPPYLDRRIAAELKTHPYRCRFIDTTTASPWRECYSPDHPMTRSDSRRFKMELLRLVSEKHKLVCGSETGHDAAVPYVHYFEGMMSLGPYRVPDAGRDMIKMWDEVPERVATFQLGHRYRLPLWELVYHDCVVAQWYWGDYNNKLPALWDKRDLFNVLYGTPPMFMFRRPYWEEHKDRFVASYQTICPVARSTACSEMTDHRFLTPDRAVQQTVFAGGVTVTVNFGDSSHRLPDGTQLAPMSHHVAGLK